MDKNSACWKHCIPEGFRKVPEGFPEGKPEGFLQCAKHCIPEGIRKVPEGFPEVNPEGFVEFSVIVRSRLAWKGSTQPRLKRFELLPGKIRKETGRYPEATFAKKSNLRARAHLVTVDAPSHAPDFVVFRGNRTDVFFVCFLSPLFFYKKKQTKKTKKNKKNDRTQNDVSRKVSGRSRKSFRKWTRKDNF